MIRMHAPWNDRAGRLSPLRLVVFLAAVAPAFWIAWALWGGRLSAEPYKQATHLTGEWTLYFLLAGLAVTPLRRLLGWGKLITVRRMLGLTAFTYAFTHLLLYVAHENGDLAKVVSEIVSRFYLTIGFVVVLGLALLAATSFDRAIRRLGRNWRRLHWAVYPLTALGLLHFYLQSKIDVTHPVLLSGVFVGLMLHRAAPGLSGRIGAAPAVLLAAIGAGLGAAGLEFGWYALASGVPAERVLLANLDFSYRIAPAWFVAAICAAPALVILTQGVAAWLSRQSAASA